MFSKRTFNKIFLGLFLIETLFYFICGLLFNSRFVNHQDMLEFYLTSVSIIISGFYAIVEKELPYLLAFCIINLAPSLIFIDEFFIRRHGYPFSSSYDITLIIARSLKVFCNILYIILFIIAMKKEHWSNKDYTIITDKRLYLQQIFFLAKDMPSKDLESIEIDVLISYMFLYGFGFAYELSNVVAIMYIALLFLPFFVLIFGPKIIKEESNGYIILSYLALLGQTAICICFIYRFYYFILIIIVTSILLLLLFINTILCHRNFGKKLKPYLKSNPKLDKAYEYLDNDKDEKGPENLKEYWDSFKSFVSKYLIGEEQLLK